MDDIYSRYMLIAVWGRRRTSCVPDISFNHDRKSTMSRSLNDIETHEHVGQLVKPIGHFGPTPTMPKSVQPRCSNAYFYPKPTVPKSFQQRRRSSNVAAATTLSQIRQHGSPFDHTRECQFGQIPMEPSSVRPRCGQAYFGPNPRAKVSLTALRPCTLRPDPDSAEVSPTLKP